uniref:Uncharacterized protein n=1 Tax=Angiostrongylus cantonensis TaxID=6313 RepID=A0A0K0DNE9_ANGCA
MNQRDIHVVLLYEWKSGLNAAAEARHVIKFRVKVVLVNQQCEHGSGNSDLVFSTSKTRKAVDVPMNLTTTN